MCVNECETGFLKHFGYQTVSSDAHNIYIQYTLYKFNFDQHYYHGAIKQTSKTRSEARSTRHSAEAVDACRRITSTSTGVSAAVTSTLTDTFQRWPNGIL